MSEKQRGRPVRNAGTDPAKRRFFPAVGTVVLVAIPSLVLPLMLVGILLLARAC
jgi:hypothetical protein